MLRRKRGRVSVRWTVPHIHQVLQASDRAKVLEVGFDFQEHTGKQRASLCKLPAVLKVMANRATASHHPQATAAFAACLDRSDGTRIG